MNKQTEALKLALEALEGWGKGFPDNWGDLDTEAITAIREALALVNEVDQEESSGTEQSAQQGWKLVPYDPSIDMQEHGSIASGYDLSQARAKRVYQAMIDMHDVMMEREPTDQYLRLEAGYPEQPAPVAEPRKPQQDPVRHWSDCATNNRGCPQLLGTCDCGGIPPKPEPIAWLLEFVDEDGLPRRDVFYESRHLQQHVKHNTDLRGLTCKITSLYTSPPASKPWAGLTDEEVMAIAFDFDVPSLVVRTVEAKLKEKND